MIERKAQLKRILPKSLAGRIRFTDHVLEKGLDLFAALEFQRLEGMVAKRVDSRYVPGRSKEWLKVKTRVGIEQMAEGGLCPHLRLEIFHEGSNSSEEI